MKRIARLKDIAPFILYAISATSVVAADPVYIYRSSPKLVGLASPSHDVSVSVSGEVGSAVNLVLSDPKYGDGLEVAGGSIPLGVTFDVETASFSGAPSESGVFVVVLRGKHPATGVTVSTSVTFNIQRPADVPIPDIADQSKTILGTSGSAVAGWLPVAPSGWAAGVVNAGDGKVWNRDGTTFTASVDLSQYGLQFDTATGSISGTPTEPFIIDDFSITVTSVEGAVDSTAPFWLGVRPATPMTVAATQNDVYVFRLGDAFETSPVDIEGTIGDLQFSSPSTITDGWDPETGVWSQDGSLQTAADISKPTSHTTTVIDEFGRTVDWSFIVDFADQLKAEAPEITAYYDVTYTAEQPLATLSTKGLLGVSKWTAAGLPNGLVLDETSGAITGAVSTTSLYTDGQEFDVPLSVTDSFDGSYSEAEAKIIARIKATIDVAIQVSTGDRHTCALKPDGSAWCWGRNWNGQVGNGSTTNVNAPKQVVGLSSDVAAISAGALQTCALKTNRSVWCWGSGYGNTPVELPTLTRVRSISAFGNKICAVKIDGNVWCFNPGQTPTQVAGISNVQQVTTGYDYACAVTADQNVWCWGNGGQGRLGNNSTGTAANPVQVQGLPTTGSGVVRVTAGWTHTCAIARTGYPYCWGRNDKGQLGIGSTGNDVLKAVPMIGVGPARKIAVGFEYTCLALLNGQAVCTGYGEFGKLGTGNNNNVHTPVNAQGLTSNVIDVAIGGAQSIAMKSDSSIAVWGRGDSGELGMGNYGNYSTPQSFAFGK
jgi:alpha-tubulin suppressor-like RCC1 family protein